MLGITPEQQMMGVGAVLSGSNLLNSKFMQDAIKKAAVAERPEIVKQIGQGLQDIAVPASFAGTKAALDQRASEKQKQKRQPLAVPMANGGPVQHFDIGGPVMGLADPIQTSANVGGANTTGYLSGNTAAQHIPIDTGNGNMLPTTIGNLSGPLGGVAQSQPSFDQNPFGAGPSSINSTTTNDMMGGTATPVAMASGVDTTQNMLTQNAVGAQQMPTIRQYTPQRPQQTVVPRRPQHGGMPTYMQNNRAYETQRQARAPYTVFPPANQLIPQGRVTPRRGVPVARMAEGGPVKKK
jgi:hypothetical protein